jgi:hypothetical protein
MANDPCTGTDGIVEPDGTERVVPDDQAGTSVSSGDNSAKPF